ncbi:right-handed parallel beta-helix repeat-containing protein [bacterium]|nr:right-handed parallel beta-helix repeat-containing protein [candidate division CSSED10-310 bacterium]
MLFIIPALWCRASFCDPLPPPSGVTVTVSTETDLRNQIAGVPPGTTILVEPGLYAIQANIVMCTHTIALRGSTGDRDDVILDFGGMSGGHFGIQVFGDDVTIADLTIQQANDHGVAIQGVDRPVLYNLHIRDIGDQLVKVNPDGDGSDDGLLACCLIEYTTHCPDDYTNGISAHLAHNWVVRDNQWVNIRGPGSGSTGPTVLFWSASNDTLVERNVFIDCYRGVAFGNAGASPGAHSGGIVRNNIFYSAAEHDVAVEMVHATGWVVAHNTAFMTHPSGGLTWIMEARFEDTNGVFINNLTNMDIWENRDGAAGAEVDCITTAESDWFVDIANRDLHLVETATAAIDAGEPLGEVPEDIDGDIRTIGGAADIGADEWTACIHDGDVNGDSGVTAADAQLAFLITLGVITPTPEEACAADCNGDGAVTAADAQLIFLTVLGSGNCEDSIA